MKMAEENKKAEEIEKQQEDTTRKQGRRSCTKTRLWWIRRQIQKNISRVWKLQKKK